MNKLGLEIYKIPSGEITNLPYLRHIGGIAKKVILSTGMSTLDEIGDALAALSSSGLKKDNITVLHANTMYPTPFEDVNLKAIETIKERFNVDVGYSDHTLGIEIAIAATMMGISVLEKHFTLDKTMIGPDHKASLSPEELKTMVFCIRNVEKSIGIGNKVPSNSEIPNIIIARKSIVASKPIKKGEIFTEKNITVKRPGSGITPMRWDEIIGTEALIDYQADEII